MTPTHRAYHRKLANWLALITVATLLLSGIALPGAQAAPQAPQAPAATWTAYNDCAWGTDQPNKNITTYTCYAAGSKGYLTKYDGSGNTSVSLSVTVNALTQQLSSSYSAEADSGTDAYNTFYGIASILWGAKFNSGTSGYVNLIFSGLDPTKTYTFATTANRNNSSYTSRLTKFILQDATVATNASTTGVTVSTTSFTGDTSVFSTGYNTVNGYVARWTGIQPGSDGDFTINATSSTEASIPAVFMLQEEGSAGPTITTTGTLNAFSTQPGVPSTAQTYTVSGSNLTAGITITPPSGFQISTDGGSTYSSAARTLPQSGGSVATTTIYVRLYSATEGTPSGTITHTSGGATQKDVAVSGTVSNCSTVNLTAAEDTYLSANDVTYNNGGNVSIHVDNNTGTGRRGALVRWDLSSIPSSATVSAASIQVNVTDASPLVFNLYNMRRTWVEGTSSQAASSTSANWNTYDGVNSWGTVGAASTSADREDTNLWGAGTTSFSTTGSKTVSLNPDGVAVVQGWIAGTTSNFGLTMQNYTGSSTNAVFFDSSEATTEANRPKLNVTYCVATGPTITTTGSLSAFSAQPGVASDAQTYTVSAVNLTADYLLITPPPGFEVSTDGVTYFSTLELEPTGGTVAATTIYVRLYSDTEGNFGGNITHASTDATTKNVAASGSVLYVYTLTAGNDGNGTVTLSPSGGSYSNGTTVTLTPAPNSGYVFSSWGGANNGEIVSTAGVYTIVMNGNKSVSANFVTATCTTIHPTATADTYLSANDVTFNNGGNTQLHVDATTGTSRRTTLLKWDLSSYSIPSNATVSAASLSLYVEDASPLVFNLYAMQRSWVEGTGSRTASTTSANWNTYDGTNSWGTVGAASTTADRYDTNLWSAGTSSFSTTGAKTEALNAAGMGVVQGWINGSLSNHGLIMQNYSGSTSNAVFFTSRDGTPAANQPKLNITYCIATTGPTIITTSSLSAFTSNIGVASAEQTYTVAGVNLTGDIVITPPADFQISLNNSDWVSNPNTISLTPTGGGAVASTPIYVRFLRATAGTSTGNITHVSSPATQVNVPVSGTASNGAPVITLVQPADNALGVSYPPALQVTVTDPDANTSSVSFYGRPVGTGSGADFTIVVVPDAQNYATSYPTVYTNHLQWIATNKTSSNIVFATAVGDLVNTSTSATEYANADTAFDTLDAGSVSYSVGPGNHDMSSGTLWPGYFGTSRFSGKSWYGGSYDDYNSYSLFSASGMDFILINLQYSPTSAQLDQADAWLKAYPGRRGIVEQHNILNTDNSWNSQASYTALKDNPNLFMMLCGHMHSGSDGAAYRAEFGDDGHTIHIIMADYQDFAGSGYLRILRFSPADDMIYMTTSSPISGFPPITSDPDQKNLAYDMASSGPYTLIGTVTGVASGSTASIGWTGLSPNTEYEWYAVASDGATSTTSATWSFTTGTGTVAVPKKPEVTSIAQSSGNVVLTWNPVTLDIAEHSTTIFRYQVYGSQDPYFTSGGTLLGSPTTATISHPAGSTGKTSWYYRVRAVNSAGPSDYSLQRLGWFQFTLVPGS